MATNTPDELISVRQAAVECGRNPETVRRWIWSGRLPAEKLGNQLFVKRIALETYCREVAAAAAAAPGESEAKESPRETVRGPEDGSKLRGKAQQHPEALISVAAQTNTTPLSFRKEAPQPGSRTETIKSMRRLREEIRGRAGNLEVESTMEELRRER